MSNEIYRIGANDEHGVNPPTVGKRTPFIPQLGRQIYENEFNRSAKNKFIEACIRQNFLVYDVKPELYDVSINERIRRVNGQNLTALVTFAYNAYTEQFNSASGLEVYYSVSNSKASQSKILAQNLYDELIQGTQQNGRGVKELNVGILSSVNCPSALIEAGFMTNLREAQLMINPIFQTEVGEEACKGICNYLGVSYIPRDNLSNYPTIRNGSKGNFVTLLQFLLRQFGYTISVDGVFGPGTQTSVQNYQQRNSLTVDGIVGSNTWKSLLTLAPFPIIKKGSVGSYVKFAQQLLESNLIPVGTIDGDFGSRTETAVKSFQTLKSLSVDGIVGANTWKALTTLP